MSHRTPSNNSCPGALVPWNPEHFQSTSRAPQSVTPHESCSGSHLGLQPRASVQSKRSETWTRTVGCRTNRKQALREAIQQLPPGVTWDVVIRHSHDCLTLDLGEYRAPQVVPSATVTLEATKIPGATTPCAKKQHPRGARPRRLRSASSLTPARSAFPSPVRPRRAGTAAHGRR
jgi:hypothetical protein